MPCRLNKTKWRISGFKNDEFQNSGQKLTQYCVSHWMAHEQMKEGLDKN